MILDIKQDTIGEILTSEHDMVKYGGEVYGDFFINSFESSCLLQDCAKSIKLDGAIFTAFLGQIRNHHMLAIFSAARQHHIQAMMNLRQVLEAGVNAAYAIANPNPKDFADITNNQVVNINQGLMVKRYKWLQDNFPSASRYIKNQKDWINESQSHSNIVYAIKNFKVDQARNKFITQFFDTEDLSLIQNDLWHIGNVAISLLDLFYSVNQPLDVIKFNDAFLAELKRLTKQNLKLAQQIISKNT